MGLMKSSTERPLRPGDIVEVRSPEEILATLDEDGTLDSMPFMPEMVRYAGRRFTVTRRVDKICDTIAATGSRRMHATVYLDDLRCDGSGHGGCQAGCLIYWKEAWLRRVDVHAGAADVPEEGTAELQRVAEATTRTVREDGADEVWRCQATDAFKASEPLKTSNPTQYWRELTQRQLRAAALHPAHGARRRDGAVVPSRPAEAAAVDGPGDATGAGPAARPPAGRARPRALPGGDRGHAGRDRPQPQAVLRPRDAPVLRTARSASRTG